MGYPLLPSRKEYLAEEKVLDLFNKTPKKKYQSNDFGYKFQRGKSYFLNKKRYYVILN